MNSINHNIHTTDALSGADQQALLHDVAHLRADRLRRESITAFWQEVGRGLGRLMATGRGALDRSAATAHIRQPNCRT